jgi:hypothetical protein
MSEQIERKTFSRWIGALFVFLFCLAIGPPIGGFFYSVIIYVVLSITSWDLSVFKILNVIFSYVTFFTIVFSYMWGGFQAGIVGFVYAIYGFYFENLPFWLAPVVGITVFGISQLMWHRTYGWDFPLLGFAHVFSAIVCWSICRAFLGGVSR